MKKKLCVCLCLLLVVTLSCEAFAKSHAAQIIEWLDELSPGELSALKAEVDKRVDDTSDTVSSGEASDEKTAEVAYGNISGNVTYYYNDYKGHVPDTGTTVIAIKLEKSEEEPDKITTKTLDKEFSLWSIPSIINSELNEENIYATEVDGTGSYTISNVPVGTYELIMISENTTGEEGFHDKERHKAFIRAMVVAVIGEQNFEDFYLYASLKKTDFTTLDVLKDKTTTYSHDFGITFI